MRILQLANFYHHTSGGLRTAVDAFGRGYVEAGHDVVLVVPGRERSIELREGRTVITLRAPRLPRSGGYRTIVDHRAVAQVVRQVRPDVIDLADRTTLARIAVTLTDRPPIVLYSHERLDLALDRRTPSLVDSTRVVDVWTRRLLQRVDRVVCASEFAAAELEPLSPRPVERVPLGVDLDTFRPSGEPANGVVPGWSPGSHHRAIYVGRLSPEKHPQDAVAAVGRLARSGRLTELLVVGDGPMRADLERSAAGLPVRFGGHVADRTAIARLLARADVALAPSPNETFGLSALEAMACGTPVAAVWGGAVGEVVVGGAGVVAGAGVNGLAAAIARLFEGDRATQRREARACAERYPWSRSVEAMLAIQASAVERHLVRV